MIFTSSLLLIYFFKVPVPDAAVSAIGAILFSAFLVSFVTFSFLCFLIGLVGFVRKGVGER